MNYPDDLYKYRALSGIGHYRHVEGNVYEDTTCKNHPNCRITVKQNGDHWEFQECVNESARSYRYFHEFCGNDSHFYPDPVSPRVHAYTRCIEHTKKQIETLKASIIELETYFASTPDEEGMPQRIENLELGDKVYTYGYRGDGEIEVKYKVFGKDGLHHLIAIGGLDILNSEDGGYLRVYESDPDEGDKEFMGFTSMRARKEYKNHVSYLQKKEQLKSTRDGIAFSERNLKRLNDELKKLLEENKCD